MQIEEMTVGECREMLARGHLARLGCALDNQPYVVPIHVAFDGVKLFGYSMLGQKIEWMRQNPLVCLEMDEIVGDKQWQTIVAFGKYEELLPSPEDEGSRREAERLFQKRPMWWEPASVPPAGGKSRPRIVFRIELHRLTGRRATNDAVEPAVEPEEARGSTSNASRSHGLTDALRRLFGTR